MSDAIREFDLANDPITGKNVLEASAGTGKTFTIAGLYVRLLLEARLDVSNILVVTFTDAATAELNDRIRTTLKKALEAFSRKAAEPGFDGKGYEQPIPTLLTTVDIPDSIRWLTQNLNTFDEASISTIHGFCRTLLQEHAFESGTQFGVDLEKDQDGTITGVVADFWRRTVGSATGLRARTLTSPDAKLNIDVLKDLVKEVLNRPDMKILPEPSVLVPPGSRAADEDLPVASSIQEAGDEAGDDEEAIAADVIAVKQEAVDYVLHHLAEKKRELNSLSFTDLLVQTRNAVLSPTSAALKEKLRNRFKAVLIDEFQDTDPVQFEIFSKLFAEGDTTLFYIGDPKQAIYGFRGADVYAYMEATVREGIRKATLARNFRSTKGLINAVNTVFAHTKDPFLIDGITFAPVGYPEEKPQSRLLLEGVEPVPLSIMFRPFVKTGTSARGTDMNKDDARNLSILHTVDEIVRLLEAGKNETTYFEEKDKRVKLDENAIAVLVRTHKHARAMQEELLKAGVHSVIHSDESIFASREARETLRVMNALAEPASARALRPALITSLIGTTAGELDELNNNGVSMGAWHEKFMLLNAHWKKNGFIEMFARLLEQEDVLSRLLKLPEGERRTANLLQLSELLQKAETKEQLSPLALVNWLEKMVASGSKEEEEYAENLATDQKAVKIVTMHKSKGLQYKIVFCPFLWESREQSSAVIFHRKNAKTKRSEAVIDIGSADMQQNKALFEHERLAEESRLAYVTLTRAEYMCCILYGNYSSTEKSALAYLLHGSTAGESLKTPIAAKAKKPRTLATELSALLADEDRVMADLAGLAAEATATIRCVKLGEPVGARFVPPPDPAAEARTIARRIPKRTLEPPGTVASFTSLAQHTGSARRRSYIDEVQAPDTAAVETRVPSILTFARGRLAGDFFHEVLETVHFDMSNADDVIANKMNKFRLDLKEAPVARTAVQNVLAKRLAGGGLRDFSLQMLPASDRLHEMNFYLPLHPFTRRNLRAFIRSYMTEQEYSGGGGASSDAMVKGWLNGKIDLLFRHGGKYYIVDWKSNSLGSTREQYSRSDMHEAMVRDDYYLQSLLYTVGTHRFLRDRIPEYEYGEHFGGVFYIFLRGVDAAAADDFGIFFDKPAEEKITALDAMIATPMPAATMGRNEHE